jgi:uncharacterized protein YndB with AHSA1/START domain
MSTENTAVNAETDFVISRTFSAPREAVYRAWTERELLEEWSGAPGTEISFRSFEPWPGGVSHYRQLAGDGPDTWGRNEFEEVVPNERLVYIQAFSDAQGGVTKHPLSDTWPLRMRTTLTFEGKESNKTNLTIRWSPVDATEVERQTFDSAHEGMRHGWNGTLNSLAAYLAKTQS